jgi:hypothetical protein
VRLLYLFAVDKINVDIPKISGGQVLSSGLKIVWLVMASVSVIVIIVAGYQYLTANGDPQKASTAMRTILFAVIGIVVAVSAFAITSFVSRSV